MYTVSLFSFGEFCRICNNDMKSEALDVGGSADVHMHTNSHAVPLKAQPELLSLGTIDVLVW